jgi:hypothetical protein
MALLRGADFPARIPGADSRADSRQAERQSCSLIEQFQYSSMLATPDGPKGA